MRWIVFALSVLIASVAFAQTGTVTGTVTDIDGNPLENARVTVGNHGHMGGGGGGMMGGNAGPLANHHHGNEYEAWTDADGAYIIEDVEPGDYTARAMMMGVGMEETDITVEADVTLTVDFVLDPDGDHGGGHMGDHGMHDWEEVSLDGWTIVEPNDWHDFYFLDVEDDGVAEYRLGFGPEGYEPPGDVELPQDGDQISITGGLMTMGGWMNDLPMVMVFTLNGETWFEPDSMGGPHNGHGGDWHQMHDNCDFEHPTSGMAEGWILIDNDADVHNMYGLDINDDLAVDFRLTYGSDEYTPGNGSERPIDGDWVEIIGGEIENCPVHPTMVVYEQNGMFWREPGDTTGLGAASLGVNDEVSAGLPVNHLVVSAYPNPFNPETTVNATLPKKADLEVAVYDILGRQIYVIDRGTVTAGTHTLTLDASNWSAGVYFVRVKANELQEVVKIQLVK